MPASAGLCPRLLKPAALAGLSSPRPPPPPGSGPPARPSAAPPAPSPARQAQCTARRAKHLVAWEGCAGKALVCDMAGHGRQVAANGPLARYLPSYAAFSAPARTNWAQNPTYPPSHPHLSDRIWIITAGWKAIRVQERMPAGRALGAASRAGRCRTPKTLGGGPHRALKVGEVGQEGEGGHDTARLQHELNDSKGRPGHCQKKNFQQ